MRIVSQMLRRLERRFAHSCHTFSNVTALAYLPYHVTKESIFQNAGVHSQPDAAAPQTSLRPSRVWGLGLLVLGVGCRVWGFGVGLRVKG